MRSGGCLSRGYRSDKHRRTDSNNEHGEEDLIGLDVERYEQQVADSHKESGEDQCNARGESA